MSGQLWFVRPTYSETAYLLTFARIIVKCTLIKSESTNQIDKIIRIFILFLWPYIIVTYTNTDVHLQFYKIVLIIVISPSNGHFNSWSILYWLIALHNFIALTMFLCGNRLQINSVAHVLKNKELSPKKAFNLGDQDFTTVFFFFFALAGG